MTIAYREFSTKICGVGSRRSQEPNQPSVHAARAERPISTKMRRAVESSKQVVDGEAIAIERDWLARERMRTDSEPRAQMSVEPRPLSGTPSSAMMIGRSSHSDLLGG